MKYINLVCLTTISIHLFCFAALAEYGFPQPAGFGMPAMPPMGMPGPSGGKISAKEMVALACSAKCEKEQRMAVNTEQLASSGFSGNREVFFSYASEEQKQKTPEMSPEIATLIQTNPEIATLLMENPDIQRQIAANPAWMAALGIQPPQPRGASMGNSPPMSGAVGYAHCVRSCELGLNASAQPKQQDNSMMLMMMLGGLGGSDSNDNKPPDFYQGLPSGEAFIGEIDTNNPENCDED